MDHNVTRLGFAWEYRTGTTRALEATPVIVGKTLYTSGNWGVVYALNAATGTPLWTFDPQKNGQSGRNTCCDVVNRGVVVSDGKVFVASNDGHLFAPLQRASTSEITRRSQLCVSYCSRCHVFGAGVLPDLRNLPAGIHSMFTDIVLRGRLSPLGMGRFDDVLTEKDVANIHAYLIDEASSFTQPSPANEKREGATYVLRAR